MHTEQTRYRIVAREVLVENLSQEDAEYTMGVYHDQGRTDLVIEEYDPYAKRLGRDPDLH
ncbi:uncharacterized protein METZ01_LOCUS72582 [marine metagenome]|uniref:Uncharacterized protein n=1 Tax=marine metagenome TaxID=408172 RepID=A0A381TW89_9ZZZZ